MTLDAQTKITRETSVGWMFQRLSTRVSKGMEARLAAHDLSLRQFAVMMTVLEHPGLSQTQIGAQFSMPGYAVSRAIDDLDAAGLVTRSAHPTSRRTHLITATAKGEALGPQLFAIVQAANAEFTAPLTASERTQLATLLGKLMDGEGA